MSTEQNKANSQRIFEEVLNAGNLAVAEDLFAPNYVLHVPTGTFRGAEGLKEYLMGMRSAFPDIQLTVEDTIAEGDKSVIRWTAHGTHRGAFQGIAPTGKQATVTALSLFRWTNGKAEEAWTVYDLLSVLQQLGVIPPMGQAS
jgi:steroid delta-isomerase-like uncharacterized protein